MKLTPLWMFVGVMLLGGLLFLGSALLSALGDAASQRSDGGVVGLFVVAVVAAAVAAAVTVALINRVKDPTHDKGEPK